MILIKNIKIMKKNTKKQSFTQLTSLYSKVCKSLDNPYSGFDMSDVKKLLEDIILSF